MISLNDAQLKTVITGAVGRTATSRESYVLILRPEPGVDGIRSLQSLLKIALRGLSLNGLLCRIAQARVKAGSRLKTQKRQRLVVYSTGSSEGDHQLF
jgi:hypothetical protein